MKPRLKKTTQYLTVLALCFFLGAAGLGIASAALPNSTGTTIGGVHYGWLVKSWTSSSSASNRGTILWQCAEHGSNQGYLIPGATNATENIGNVSNQVGTIYANDIECPNINQQSVNSTLSAWDLEATYIGKATAVTNATFSNATITTSTDKNLVLTPFTVTGNQTLTIANGSTYFLNLSANSTINIPSAVTAGAGFTLNVQDLNTLSATHTATLQSTSGNLNGAATAVWNTANKGGLFVSDGTNWWLH